MMKQMKAARIPICVVPIMVALVIAAMMLSSSVAYACSGGGAGNGNVKYDEKGYSVSTGTAMREKKELDMNALLKEAEQYMYKEKRKYYEQLGHDRRQQRASAPATTGSDSTAG